MDVLSGWAQRSLLRFGEDKAVPKPKKTYSNPEILPPLARLVGTYQKANHVSDAASRDFAFAWVRDPNGAIATLQQVVQKALSDIKSKPVGSPKDPNARRQDAAFVEGRLDRFMSFFRRQHWDNQFPGQILREFAQKPARNEEIQLEAYKIGLPANQGAWHAFVNFVRKEIPAEFKQALQAVTPQGTSLEIQKGDELPLPPEPADGKEHTPPPYKDPDDGFID